MFQRETEGARRMCGGAKKHLDDTSERTCARRVKNKIAAGTRGRAAIHGADGAREGRTCTARRPSDARSALVRTWGMRAASASAERCVRDTWRQTEGV